MCVVLVMKSEGPPLWLSQNVRDLFNVLARDRLILTRYIKLVNLTTLVSKSEGLLHFSTSPMLVNYEASL